MKKILFVFSFSFILLLYGCSRELSDLLIENDIETLKSWSFQFNKGTNDYSLFFGLLNKSDEYISADVDVDIRIVNESDEEVYKGRKSVSKSDFSYYISKTKGEQYLANVRIPMTDIISGKSSDGKVFFTVYQSDICIFDEVNCSALSCLPIEDIQLTFDSLPKELKVKDYDGSTESIMQINDISY
ncbi:MAG: hypothetical protein HFG31_02170 [Eubacterium sp.]|nr:hypothetical protein [Eubacterium sp.]